MRKKSFSLDIQIDISEKYINVRNKDLNSLHLHLDSKNLKLLNELYDTSEKDEYGRAHIYIDNNDQLHDMFQDLDVNVYIDNYDTSVTIYEDDIPDDFLIDESLIKLSNSNTLDGQIKSEIANDFKRLIANLPLHKVDNLMKQIKDLIKK